MTKGRFTVRVYGIYISEKNEVLLCNEMIRGKRILKFPGGGLEYGEGTRECLAREMMEETSLRFFITEHFYTTDFFVESAFDSGVQVMSIYYLMKPEFSLPSSLFKVSTEEKPEVFLMKPVDSLSDNDLPLIIDRKVMQMLKKQYGAGTR